VEKILSYIGEWRVPVVHQKSQIDNAIVGPADAVDMSSSYFHFQWEQIWQKTCFGWEGIVKLIHEDNVLGLMQFALQPDQEPEDDQFIPVKQPGFLEVVYLEACKDREARLIDPIGKWLLWYAVQVAFRYCEGSSNGAILGLFSSSDACNFYQEKVKMERGGFSTSQQGIETTPFKFTKEGAEDFCEQLYNEYGNPVPITS
jgi:hypothetical protein